MCSLAGQRFGRGAKPRVAVLCVHGGSNAFRAEAAEVASNAVTPAAANTDPSVPRDFDQAGASEISEVARSCERAGRSEEHTSELQSLMRNSYAVFCLKKKIFIYFHNIL